MVEECVVVSLYGLRQFYLHELAFGLSYGRGSSIHMVLEQDRLFLSLCFSMLARSVESYIS